MNKECFFEKKNVFIFLKAFFTEIGRRKICQWWVAGRLVLRTAENYEKKSCSRELLTFLMTLFHMQKQLKIIAQREWNHKVLVCFNMKNRTIFKQIRSYFDFSQPNLSFFWHILSVNSSARGRCCDLMLEYIRKLCANPLSTYNPWVVLFMELSQAFCHTTAIPSYVVFFLFTKALWFWSKTPGLGNNASFFSHFSSKLCHAKKKLQCAVMCFRSKKFEYR